MSWQTFSVKGQIVNILSFADHIVSVATMQLCHCKVTATVDNVETNELGCVLIQAYLQQ